jgi:hypothetical protein
MFWTFWFVVGRALISLSFDVIALQGANRHFSFHYGNFDPLTYEDFP